MRLGLETIGCKDYENMDVAIIGGGAAGFFAAVSLKELNKEINVTVFEKNGKVLSKLAVSGGGRCNVTNTFEGIKDLSRAYPRGNKLLKRIFNVFDYNSAYAWFESRGVPLVVQDDYCVFPESQDSQTIIDCFLRLSHKLDVRIKTGYAVESIRKDEAGFALHFKDAKLGGMVFDKVLITTGGSPREEGLTYLENLGHRIESPVPSLFTFNIKDALLRDLMGTVVEKAIVSLKGTKFRSDGALLVTHWGMSGPAILKLSSYGARDLKDRDYRAEILVNWVNEPDCDEIVACLNSIAELNTNKQLGNIRPYDLPSRLWLMLLSKIALSDKKCWGELGRKGINKIMNVLCNDTYAVDGKGVFRDEFVTCGGISLKSVNPSTMESRVCPGLYFAGEVLDIDGITGGFNFQAAWSTAYAAASSMAKVD